MKKMLLFAALLSIFSACTNADAGLEIKLSGVVNNPQVGLILLEEFGEQGPIPVDTIILNSDNTFELSKNLTSPGFYRINFYGNQVVNLVLDKEDIVVNVDGDARDGFFEVQGSTDMKYLEEVNLLLLSFESRTQDLNQEFQAASHEENIERMTELQNIYMKEQKAIMNDLKSKIRNMGNSIAAIQAVNYLNKDQDFEFIDSIATKLLAVHPNSVPVKLINQQLEGARKLAVGSMAPEIDLPNPDGKNIKLSSLRGKYVMIDFWAAWCKPCRMENPNVVKAFNKYNAQGFEVYGVSLDRNREDWLRAIEMDGLTWTQVSDLKYFNSEAAAQYQIQAIPATYLIDKEGKIIAKNLRGEALERKLEEIFSN